MRFTNPKDIDVKSLSIHPEANMTPLMTEEQYNSLKNDIERNGQLDPIILYRGKVIDGRHRLKVAQELGKDNIKTVSMPNNSTLAEIRSVVKSKETHRHQTPTQLAIYAMKHLQKHNEDTRNKDKQMTQLDAANEFGVVVKQIGRAIRIETKLKRPDIIDSLYAGNKINIGTAHRPLMTDSLQSVINYLESTKVKELQVLDKLKISEEPTEEENMLIANIKKIISEQRKIVRDAIFKDLTEI